VRRPARAPSAGSAEDVDGVTIGVVGRPWRARVSPWGAIVPADGTPVLDWWVAAEDRWHTPAREPAVRQRAVDGTPVVETVVRVPGGDVVQTVYAVADRGGFTVVELDNRSPGGIAVALSRRDLATSRPPSTVPVAGVDAPSDALVVPIGHRSSVRVALAHDGRGAGPLPAELPPPDAVVRGWLALAGRSVDLRLPPRVALAHVRCALLLDGPPAPVAGPAFLVAVAELGRLGEDVQPWVDEVVVAGEAIGRRCRRTRQVSWADDAALLATREVLARAGHERGASDVLTMRARLPAPAPTPPEPPLGALALAWAERRMVVPGPRAVDRRSAVDLLPAPFPPMWAGQPVEAYGVPLPRGLTVGVAVRWHVDRPALLWEVVGGPARLTCSGLDLSWSSDAPKGEALLTLRPAPP
jgi:hypothetical protein